jgi:hypothetical protein
MRNRGNAASGELSLARFIVCSSNRLCELSVLMSQLLYGKGAIFDY